MSIEKSSEEKINSRLKKLVNDLCGGNQSKFAGIAGINIQTFHTYIKGRPPNTEALYGICRNFAVNINWLLTGEGPERIEGGGVEKELKNNFLLEVEEWIEDIARRDQRKKIWFEVQLEKAFPEFTYWRRKKGSGDGENTLFQNVA